MGNNLLKLNDSKTDVTILASPHDLPRVQHHSLDSLVLEYNDVISGIVDNYAPQKKHTMVVRSKVPWFTEEIKEAKRKCRQLERKWRQTHLTIHREMFQAQRLCLKMTINKSKSSYFNSKIINCSGDQKKLFKITKDLLHTKDTVSLPKYTSAEALATRFNEYFTTKIVNIRDELDLLVTNDDMQPEVSTSQPLLHTFKPTSHDEIRKIIKESSGASCCLDPWPTWLLKDYLDDVTPIVTNIVNNSLQDGEMPASLKNAVLRPLLKKSGLDPEILKNYRPISNIPYIAKVVEKVVASTLNDHMSEHHMHEPLQSAYKSAHSTESALLRVQNDLLMAMDNKKNSYLVLLDLSAAFDTVDHTYLIGRMASRLRIGGSALQWFTSYLTGRTQRVKIGDAFSSLVHILFGVPQGSVLGPLLYLVYTLPIGDIIRQHRLKYHIYADDTQLYVSFDVANPNNQEDALCRIQRCIEDISTWMAFNKLKLNSDKTEVIILSSAFNRHTPDLSNVLIGDSPVILATTVRNLGVVFDRYLTMDAHITKMCSTAYYHLRNISSIRSVLNKKSAVMLIHAFVTSRIDYCNSLLAGVSKLALSKLQRVQNMAARMVMRIKKCEHITPILKELHWLPVEHRIKFKVLLLTFKSIHGDAPAYLSELIIQRRPTRQLRSSEHLMLDVPKTRLKSACDRTFTYQAARLWNALPLNIRSAQTLLTFKNKLKTFLFNASFNE